MRRRTAWLSAVLLLAAAPASAELSITRITPDGGDVEPGAQIVVAFDRDVVPLGRMERKPEEVPVTITPAPACQWRWLDPQTLACQLAGGGRLQAATRYTVEVRPGLVAVSGERLARGRTQSFVTRRPQLRWAGVVDWTAPTVPVVRLGFDQPVTAASVAATFTLGGAAVEVLADPHDAVTPWYVPGAADAPGQEAREAWWLRPAVPLPADRDVALRLMPGLASAFGTETGIEHRDALRLHTFGEPRVLGLRCRLPDGGDDILVAASGTGPAGTKCDPLEGLALVFNVPVAPGELKRGLRMSPAPLLPPGATEAWDGAGEGRSLATPNTRGEDWSVVLPFPLQAATDYRFDAADLEDRFGRRFARPLALRFATAHRSPALGFDHTTAVIEQGVDSEVPVVVTNLERLLLRYTRIDGGGAQPGLSAQRPVERVEDIAHSMPLGVRGLLDGKAGVVDGRVSTEPRTDPPVKGQEPGEHFFAEVTPWQVHVKLGHYDTLVWVTEFATGRPVAAAEVAVFAAVAGSWQPEDGAAPRTVRTDADGLAVLPGAETLDPEFRHRGWTSKTPMAVRVTRGADFALLPLQEEFNVDIYRASRNQVETEWRRRYGHLKSWGTTAQGVYRAGDPVQYKVYVRNDGPRGLEPAPEGPYRLRVYDPANQVVHQRDELMLSAFGALDGSFTVPKQGKVGWYRFELEAVLEEAKKPAKTTAKKSASRPDAGSDDADDERRRQARTLPVLRVLVSDFTPAPFGLSAEIRTARAAPGTPVTAAMHATLHAGGAYANAPATLSARVVAEPFVSKDATASKFAFDGQDERGGQAARDSRGIAERQARTDGQGEFATELVPPESDIAWGRLVVEAGAQDDRGRSVAAIASVPYAGRDRLVGIRAADWLLQQDRTTQIETLVVDADGRPVAGVPYYVKVERREVSMARVKDAGSVYVARYSEKWVGVQICKGRSAVTPSPCRFRPDTGGAYRITAMTRDTARRLHTSSLWRWASGSDTFLWQEADDYGLELVPEKKGPFKVGETARFLVKNPYPGATALITTERYGVIGRRTQVLEGSAPVIEVPITAELLPGFYLGVVVQSPRVAAPPPEHDVDLGKPTFRMGYATVDVDDRARHIDVTVTPERAQYQPRETAKVEIAATLHSPPDGRAAGEAKKPSPPPVELAVVVLDEAVYDLVKGGNAYFDPYAGFNRLDPLDLANYSLLTRLVGRQKFEKKGATPGGDGGVDLSLRSVDQYVAYWNPSVPMDAQGHARIEFRLPDNLTAWKVLVLAVTPGDRMGLGSGRFTVSRRTELRPALPNQVSVGDVFQAGFTVMNRADAPRTLKVKLHATQSTKGMAAYDEGYETELALKPFERRTVSFAVAPPQAGTLAFTATAGDAQDSDGLKQSLEVRPRRPTATAADFGVLDGTPGHERADLQLRVPAGSAPGAELGLRYSATALGNLDGAFRYLRDYPYDCWEQRVSRAVMAAHYLRLKPHLASDFRWTDAEARIGTLYDEAASYQAPSGGMAFWDADEAHVSPYLSAYTALAFEWLRAEGRPPPKPVVDRLDRYLDGLLRKDVPEHPQEAGSSVRAVVLAALAARGRLQFDDLQRFAPALPRMGLFGQAMFAQAAAHTEGGAELASNALRMVIARGQESASGFVLRETEDSFWPWLLGSETRSNCAALSALLARPPADADGPSDGADSLAGLPMKLVRSIAQARAGPAGGAHADHWGNTQENVFCTTAMDEYAQRYEATAPAFTLSATLDGEPSLKATMKRRDARAEVTMPMTEAQTGKPLDLVITREGQGRGYWAATLRYVERDADVQAASAGLTLKRRYAVKRDGRWVDLAGDAATPMTVERGEWLRVTLTLDSPATRSFVVVDDPLPGALEPLNPDLATSSGLAAEDAAPPGGAYPYPFFHRELRFDAARFFADRLPAGTHTLTWIGQAVAIGRFAVPSPRAGQMYDPDVFGSDVPGVLVVEETTGGTTP